MSRKRESFFWVSYSDMMTSMFFIMLLLFILSSAGIYLQGKANEDELKIIREMETAVNQLPKKYFKSDTINKRWVLREEYMPHFYSKDFGIPVKYRPRVLEVGRALQSVVATIEKKKNMDAYKDMNIKYVIIIEGMSSNIGYEENDYLSYKRALALYYFWKHHGISFESTDCEVQVSGSGVRGKRPYNRLRGHYSLKEEQKNQCIIIQIIPKIGVMK